VKFTGEVIHSLENVIEEASLASLQIVSVIREEYVAMEQIDISIREINKITHLFSESTEQTSKATIGLSKIAESLKNTVNQYNVYE
jgi:methyl-accepting chemotaxis protein